MERHADQRKRGASFPNSPEISTTDLADNNEKEMLEKEF